MKASEIRKNVQLMNIFDLVAEGRKVKTHNYEGGEPHTTFEECKWLHYSLTEVYKNPSQYKIAIDEHIRNNVSDALTVIRPWEYRGNSMTFTMSTVIQFAGEKYGLTFTKDNLHVVGFDY